jgi:hypothetical protein
MPFRREEVEALIRLTDEAMARQANREAVLDHAAAMVRANTLLQRSAGIEKLSDAAVTALIVLLMD